MNIVKKKWFSISNITTGVMVVFLAAMILNPEVKAWTIQTLMKVGLFQPKIGKQPDDVSTDPLPNALFRDGDGKTIDLASLKGKVIFINFWATWCPPCIAEMPSIDALYRKFKDNDNVVFLMVDVDDNYEKSASFMKKHHYALEVMSPANEIPTVFMQGAIPTTVILSKEGKMVYRQEGAADYNSPELVDMISKLSR
ncbi:TlpA family protein disulfide reductase [Dyadobacter luteus]|uniref:TlpA family protein disulfide reductase n=1 Tax=Dyadobacter luteus TaxID=2259619 RepID=A0A3D8Y9E4_9BACT|nr:TlpA disulfide reductase family protein [Dyadobacter luteus]REA60105.1 TlpA family protein disulfide reductase [Dyadobacter luteus]